VNSETSTTKYDSTSKLSVASASKWVYGSYVAQKLKGELTDVDRKYLAMRAGYVDFDSCQIGQTVGECATAGTNGNYTATADGKFSYGGGHFQQHAVTLGLGAMTASQLTAEVRSQLGADLGFSYRQPQLAGGLVSTADEYTKLLRKILANELAISSMLGSGAVCTNAWKCRDESLYAPIPLSETWHYSVGHWVEDDPAVGDGAYSSPGAFGFYPWIDKSKTYYGVVARSAANGAFASVQCGRKIRAAWMSGIAQ
jgi:hypothetical protein